MFKKIVIIIIILCSVDFFTLIFIPDVIQKGADILALGLTVVLLVLMYFYDNSTPITRSFNFPIILIFISVAISMFAAYAFQDQGITITLWSQRAIYYYLVYYLLSRLRPHPDFIMKVILWFGAAYMIIYIAQSIVYPFELLSYRLFLDRGTVRIFMPGAGYFQLGYYISLYLFFKNYKLSNLLYLLSALVVIVLLGSRQLLASTILITFLFLFLNQVVKAKAVLITMMIISLLPLYFLFKDILMAMVEVTTSQSKFVEENIRIRAAEFFLTDFLNSPIAYFTGNGAHGNSSMYGLRVQKFSLQYGFYQSDIGLIGDYVRFGLIYVVGVLIFIFKVFKSQLPDKSVAVKYFFIAIILMMFTGSSTFSNSSGIVILCLMFYIVDSMKLLNQSENQRIPENIFTS